MSRTRKDARRYSPRPITLKVVKNADGAYEVFYKGKLTSRVPERWLEEILCARLGFCGDEYDAIIRQVEDSGKAVVLIRG